jgi:hypothetical protein
MRNGFGEIVSLVIRMKNDTHENWNRREFTALKSRTEIAAQIKVFGAISLLISEKTILPSSSFSDEN